jgi:hypothetical protein
MNETMQVVVKYGDKRLELEVPSDRLVAAWDGPAGLERGGAVAAVANALEEPWDFPPVRQMIVPGDCVTIALDATLPEPEVVLEGLGEVLRGAGVEARDVTVLSTATGIARLGEGFFAGARRVVHDPSERSDLAYLAATKEGKRVYLSRALTDADVVIPVGRLGFDPITGYRGPWSVIFPESSDQAALDAHRRLFRDKGDHTPQLAEAFEVSWLLGSQFHLGVVPGATGLSAVVAGREQSVRERGIASVNSAWTVRASSRAEMVVVGLGAAGERTTLELLADGLWAAASLVQHGGKIVVLSNASGTLGPALSRLTDLDDAHERTAALRGREADSDFVTARRLAQSLDWADIFLLSELAPEVAESLSLVSLESGEQARRLVARSGSVTLLSRGELVRTSLSEEESDDVSG